MTNFVFIFTFIFSFQVFGEVDDSLAEKKANYQINETYKSGSYLIYDCWRGYYACVDQDGFNHCKAKRKEGADKKLSEFSCAPLKKFLTKEACGYKNYEVIAGNTKKRFCYPKN